MRSADTHIRQYSSGLWKHTDAYGRTHHWVEPKGSSRTSYMSSNILTVSSVKHFRNCSLIVSELLRLLWKLRNNQHPPALSSTALRSRFIFLDSQQQIVLQMHPQPKLSLNRSRGSEACLRVVIHRFCVAAGRRGDLAGTLHRWGGWRDTTLKEAQCGRSPCREAPGGGRTRKPQVILYSDADDASASTVLGIQGALGSNITARSVEDKDTLHEISWKLGFLVEITEQNLI